MPNLWYAFFPRTLFTLVLFGLAHTRPFFEMYDAGNPVVAILWVYYKPRLDCVINKLQNTSLWYASHSWAIRPFSKIAGIIKSDYLYLFRITRRDEMFCPLPTFGSFTMAFSSQSAEELLLHLFLLINNRFGVNDVREKGVVVCIYKNIVFFIFLRCGGVVIFVTI